MAGDALAQGGEAEGLCIADAAVLERRPGGLAGPARRRRRGLPHLHMDDAVASPFFRRGGGQHIHGEKRGHPPATAGKIEGLEMRGFAIHKPGFHGFRGLFAWTAALNRPHP